MIIYETEYGICDFFKIFLDFPRIAWMKEEDDESGWCDKVKVIRFDFSTKLLIEHSENDKWFAFSLNVLGFGVSIVRQKGY